MSRKKSPTFREKKADHRPNYMPRAESDAAGLPRLVGGSIIVYCSHCRGMIGFDRLKGYVHIERVPA